jgi:hypothetical protein
MLLHGEQSIEVFKTIKAGEKYKFEERLIDVADKVKGVLILKELKCTDSRGELVSISM